MCVELELFEKVIKEAHAGRNDLLWEACALQCEAAELADLIMKNDGYNKPYTKDAILSEAGDVLNFLTAILIAHDLNLDDAMFDNINKLKARGWIK